MSVTDELVDQLIKEKKEIETQRLADPFNPELIKQHKVIIERCKTAITQLYNELNLGNKR